MSSPAVNPFTGQSASAATIPVPGFLRDWGFRLQESMLDAARVVNDGDGGDIRAFSIAVLIAVLFGMVHIIGPGHGKLFTIGYFGSRKAKLREGFLLSALVNILDSLSALLLVGIAYGILSASLRSAGIETGRITRLIAYGSITILSSIHLAGHLSGRHKEHKETMKPWVLALSVGLIPCPVSSAILAWGIVNHALGFAIVLVLGVSIGGMIAMSAFSLLIIAGKNGFAAVMEKQGFNRALSVFETISMGFLVAAGLLLFVSAL